MQKIIIIRLHDWYKTSIKEDKSRKFETLAFIYKTISTWNKIPMFKFIICLIVWQKSTIKIKCDDQLFDFWYFHDVRGHHFYVNTRCVCVQWHRFKIASGSSGFAFVAIKNRLCLWDVTCEDFMNYMIQTRKMHVTSNISILKTFFKEVARWATYKRILQI